MTTPRSWPIVPLGQVLTKSDEWIGLNPAETYRQVTVRLWGKGVTLRGEITGAEIAATRQCVVHARQFIASRNGAFGLIPDSLEDAIVTSDFPVFSLNQTRMLPEYLHWLSKTGGFVELCKAASEGTTNRVRLKEDRFLALEIPLPPLPEQRRIVARIEQLAAQIEEARRVRHQATEETEALQTAARRVVISDCQAKTVALEEACTAIIDNLHSNPRLAEAGIPCVRSPDVGYGTLKLDTAQRTDEDEFQRRTVRGEPQPDDIVLVREGGGTGKCAVVLPGQRFSLGQRVMMLRPNPARILPRFFLHQLLSPLIQEDQIAPLSKGSASPHLNIGTLKRFKLRLPTLDEQRRIVMYLDGLVGQVAALARLQSETASALDALLPSVLDKAFKGEL